MKQNLFGVCPYLTAQKLLSGKWAIYILFMLSDGALRFNELQRRMPEDITHTSLSRQLKSLEEEGLILRKDYCQVPPKVEYTLSPMGEEFAPVLSALERFGLSYISHLNTQGNQKKSGYNSTTISPLSQTE